MFLNAYTNHITYSFSRLLLFTNKTIKISLSYINFDREEHVPNIKKDIIENYMKTLTKGSLLSLKRKGTKLKSLLSLKKIITNLI